MKKNSKVLHLTSLVRMTRSVSRFPVTNCLPCGAEQVLAYLCFSPWALGEDDFLLFPNTVQHRYNEEQRDCENMLVITKFRCIEVLFHIFYSCWARNQGFNHIEVR